MADLEWQQVDWTEIPVAEVAPVSAGYEKAANVEHLPVSVVPDSDIVEHSGTSVDDLLELYRDAGFETDVILQNPLTHRGPAAACTMGFPLGLPSSLQGQDLKKFRRWVCRIHVDIKQRENGTLFSIPHVEVDPVFHLAEHLALNGQEVYGKTSVKLLKTLLT